MLQRVRNNRQSDRSNAPRGGSNWNALELTKLFVSILTPLAVLLVGVVINGSMADKSRMLTQRLKIYETIGENLNDIHVYFTYVGDWKELSPIDIIQRKRNADKFVQIYKPFLSNRFYTQYVNFMSAVYERRDPKLFQETRLRTESAIRITHFKKTGEAWDPSWNALFTEEKVDAHAVRVAYETLTRDLAVELQLELDGE